MANQTTVYRGNDGRMYLNLDTSKTLAGVDSGIVQNVIADGITLTLPATANGLSFIIRNGGAKATNGPTGAVSDGSVLVTVAPNASDGFTGNNFSAATNKAALNTKATALVGDEIQIDGNGTTGATGWNFSNVKGIWARAA